MIRRICLVICTGIILALILTGCLEVKKHIAYQCYDINIPGVDSSNWRDKKKIIRDKKKIIDKIFDNKLPISKSKYNGYPHTATVTYFYGKQMGGEQVSIEFNSWTSFSVQHYPRQNGTVLPTIEASIDNALAVIKDLGYSVTPCMSKPIIFYQDLTIIQLIQIFYYISDKILF